MEEMIQEKVTQKENELNATYDERIRNYEERSVYLGVRVAVSLTRIQRAGPSAPGCLGEESAPRPQDVP